MKLQFTLAIIAAAFLSFSPGSAHLSDPCINKLLSQTPSPDGKLILATYHRECRWTVLTVANVEKPRTPSGVQRRSCLLPDVVGRPPSNRSGLEKQKSHYNQHDR